MYAPDFVMCPLVDEEVEAIDCIVNSDAVDRILKKDVIPEKCKWHGY